MTKEYMILMDNGEYLDGVISEERLYDLRMSKEPFFYFKGVYYNKYKIEKITPVNKKIKKEF